MTNKAPVSGVRRQQAAEYSGMVMRGEPRETRKRTSACIRRHQAFVMAAVMQGEQRMDGWTVVMRMQSVKILYLLNGIV